MVLKVSLNTGINRIRLEFKDNTPFTYKRKLTVLIESDWNLKCERTYFYEVRRYCINRIRLEFKAKILQINKEGIGVLIESDWNLKPEPKPASNPCSMY